LAVIELRDTGRAILSGLHRPTHATLKALFYPVWDMACMSLALALAMRMYEQPSIEFWHTWFLDLPVWVTPTFSLFAISRTYVTVWTRARLLDVLMITFILVLGSLLSLAIALVIDPSESSRWLFRFLVISALSHPAIIGVRIIYRSLEELVIYFRARTETRAGRERVLL
jgi:FlaA1/EpsC-like NDP-sugar epimerase